MKHKGSGWIFNILFSFNFQDGLNPQARVVFGPNGTLYGTTSGGAGKMRQQRLRHGYQSGPSPQFAKPHSAPGRKPWSINFTGGHRDGALSPSRRPHFRPAGNLYGTTSGGRRGLHGCGAVYELTPSGGGWTESILYSFSGGGDGACPSSGVIPDNGWQPLWYDDGRRRGYRGTVYELTPSDGGWTESILYNFSGGSDGDEPEGRPDI